MTLERGASLGKTSYEAGYEQISVLLKPSCLSRRQQELVLVKSSVEIGILLLKVSEALMEESRARQQEHKAASSVIHGSPGRSLF